MLNVPSFVTLLSVCFLIGTQIILCFGTASPTFVIKHVLSGKVFHPYGGWQNPGDGTSVVLYSGVEKHTHFRFEQQYNHWGYLVHVSSGKVIHPKGGSLSPGTGTHIVLYSTRHAGAYWAIDQTRKIIMHKGGKYLHPKHSGWAVPPNNDDILLYPEISDGMKFELVSPTDTNKEVPVYGKPKLVGKWKIINMYLNPKAEHTYTMKVKVGKSKTESKEFSFTYKWESSGGFDIGMFSGSAGPSIETMLKRSSSSTWSTETERTRQIKVKPGKTVVTWQFVYTISQDEHKGVYGSNIVADTSSENEVPRELGNVEVI